MTEGPFELMQPRRRRWGLHAPAFFSRRKQDSDAVGADGQPLVPAAQDLTWCRVALSLSLCPPKTGQVLVLEQGPRTRRLVLWAPKLALISLTTAFVGSVPWVQQLAHWLLKHWPGISFG